MDFLKLINRSETLFTRDLQDNLEEIGRIAEKSRFLVVGGAGSIGQMVVKELFALNPGALHIVDISENNLVELVRDIRSSMGYISGDFKTFALDCASREYSFMVKSEGPYDFIFNLSAIKHVRSEKDPYTLMRMVDVNIINTINTIDDAVAMKSQKYFCVSTDKAANPANMMGASKRIMEMFLMQKSRDIPISTARFANVAFSDGSLLHGFNQRIQKLQPISAPLDVKRYFILPKESGELCLLSGLLGENRDIFFPRLSEELNLITFSDIAVRYLEQIGYEPFLCHSEDEARAKVAELAANKKWPCYFFESDTTGEKDFEEFFTENEEIDFTRFKNIGIIKNNLVFDEKKLAAFLRAIDRYKEKGEWGRDDLKVLFSDMLDNFYHKETGKFLDNRM